MARPPTPLWSELSGVLQVHLHEALTRQASPDVAIRAAAAEMRAVIAERAPTEDVSAPGAVRTLPALPVAAAIAAVFLAAAGLLAFLPARDRRRSEARFGWRLALPSLLVLAVLGGVPLVLTIVQSFLEIDLRTPWRGTPFVGGAHYAGVVRGARFLASLAHTGAFAAVSVSLELGLGLALALVLHGRFFGRGAVRGVALVPWAVPAVVGAVLWRFLFERVGPEVPWTGHPWLAWLPIVVADVWKSTPFVTLLLLAGLAQIDSSIIEAAKMDGASARVRLVSIVLPLLRPAIVVAVVFRALDALRVFDLIYVMTGGGPGRATETVSLLAYDVMMRDLRFGAGAAVSTTLFAITLSLALVYVRLVREEDAS